MAGRGGAENSASVGSGSLVSPNPSEGGIPEGPGNEEHETQLGEAFNAQVALAAVKGDKMLAELAEQSRVHLMQITEWNQQLLARDADVFGRTNPTSDTLDLKTLHAKIGQLALENDFLEGALPRQAGDRECPARQSVQLAFVCARRQRTGCKLSMDGRGALRDNVFVKRLWQSVKYERVYLYAYDSVAEARTSLPQYLGRYNQSSVFLSKLKCCLDEANAVMLPKVKLAMWA